MHSYEFISHSEEETIRFADEFASKLNGHSKIVLSGDLGSGKTKFTEGLLRHFGLEDEISSPTFTIVNEYDAPKFKIYHFDLYRLEDADEFYAIGGEEYLQTGLCIFEWGEMIENIIQDDYIRITFSRDNDADNLDLRKSFITTELGIAHNGIIRSYNGKNNILNDTQLFIKNDLFELNSLDKKFYKNVIFQSMIERLIDGSRLVFLNKKGEIIKLGNWFHNGNYYFSNLNHVSKNTLNINKKPILFDNDLKYFDEENNDFVINDEVVDKDYFDLFIDTLDRLENGDSVYSEDYFQEYNSFNGKYYLNKKEKMIYELIGDNELMFVDYYKSKEEYYKLKL